MIGIQPLIDICSLTLQTAYLKEHNGVSLLLIASPETAKTTTIFNFNNLDFVSYYDEITAKKLIDEFLPMCKLKQKRTLLIPDLINCIDKQKSTRNQFLNILKSGIDDIGITKIETYHKHLDIKEIAYHQYFSGVRFNMVSAITSNSFSAVQKRMKATGLLSRFLPFSYDYPINKVTKIFDFLEKENTDNDFFIPKIVKRETAIQGNSALFSEFRLISSKLGEFYGGYGFRCQKSLQRLAKANALMNGRKEVIEEDIQKILELSRWINYDFNSL